MRRPHAPAQRAALGGLLLALCCALSAAEGAFAGWVGLPPGVKPGLANVVILYALFFINGRCALALTVLKAAFVLLTRGFTAGLLSGAGGLLSLAVTAGLARLPRLSWMALSMAGALAHNVGQLAALCLLMHSFTPAYYLPVLTLSALGCGALCALVLGRLVRAPALAAAALAARGRRRPPQR